MYKGERWPKETLVEYGFRLPSALDNRPLRFDEFERICPQTIYVSATPGPYELDKSSGAIAEQVVRPTGLIDPPTDIRPASSQVDDLLGEIRLRAEKKERSEEHTSELQSLMRISYAVFCLKKKTINK